MMNNSQGASSFFSGLSTLLGRPHPLLHNLSDTTPHEPIADYFEPLSEDHLIGADASIIDFVMQAENHPVRLVVSDDEVAGLVSLSDLQHLPVRAAIFTLITSLERGWVNRCVNVSGGILPLLG